MGWSKKMSAKQNFIAWWILQHVKGYKQKNTFKMKLIQPNNKLI